MTNAAEPSTYVYPGTERVVHGRGALQRLAVECDALGAARALLITTPSLAGSPLQDVVVDALGDRVVAVLSDCAQHVPMPILEQLLGSARDVDADVVVSLGGGSVIDAGKALAAAKAEGYLTAHELLRNRIIFDPPATVSQELFTGDPIPHIAIPTTLSAAEWDGIFGITHEGTKDLYADPRLAPKVVVLDPAATALTPPELWACSGIRALDHAVEIYLSRQPSPVTDATSLHALRLLTTALPASMQDPSDMDARLRCQQAAWLSMVGVENVTLGLCHGIGHQIGARCGVPHGITSCVMLPTVLGEMVEVVPHRLADVGVAMGLDRAGRSDGELAAAVGPEVRRFVAALGLPTTLSEVGVSESDFPLIARDAVRDIVVASAPIEVDERDVVRLLQRAMG
jgi:maleylacetate reductase